MKDSYIINYIRNHFIFLMIALYLLIGAGFMQVRIPPTVGTGVPVGEVVLILMLLSVNPLSVLLRINKIVIIIPFLVWWLHGFISAFVGLSNYGVWALRDATHVIESMYLIVGFVVVARAENLMRFFRYVPLFLGVAVLYSLGYLFRDDLKPMSPVITSVSGHETALFFNYVNTSMLLILAATYLVIIQDRAKLNLSHIIGASLLMVSAIFLFQARTVYLQILAVLFLILFFRKRGFGRLIVALMLAGMVVISLPMLGIEIQGRLGQVVSLDFLGKHFLSIVGVESEGVEASASGVSQRIEWWLILYYKWTEGVTSFLLGLGYGFPLVDFYGSGHLVREPHNSYVSIIARLGLLGMFSWLLMHIALISTWFRAYRLCTKKHWKEGQDRLILFMGYFVLTWVYAIGEDAFEKPFVTIPYYFLWGVILRFYYQLKNVEIHEAAPYSQVSIVKNDR